MSAGWDLGLEFTGVEKGMGVEWDCEQEWAGGVKRLRVCGERWTTGMREAPLVSL